MDTYRGANTAQDNGLGEVQAGYTQQRRQEPEAPPPMIGTDERRMQVRAYNFWASLLDNRLFPDIADLDPASRHDFGPYSVLLDFSAGNENPLIVYLGNNLAHECEADAATIKSLADVPPRSLLSRITDHYMQIIANQAPIGFEAEFVNNRGATVLYRGILLPYSSDDSTIDFIYGVINWKELADQRAADELLLELDNALDSAPAPKRAAAPLPIADWADGPGALTTAQVEEVDYLELSDEAEWADPFALPAQTLPHAAPATILSDGMALGDWLAAAREQACVARERDDRSRNALYDAIGRAWDFALAAENAPGELAELLEDAGFHVQQRAPMTPVVKLVFGADYDKTRLTEYAAALTYAKRIGLGQGMLAEHLLAIEGGLKGVVTIERRYRREAAGLPPKASQDQPRSAIARKLRKLPAHGLDSVAADGKEFALVMLRRSTGGEVQMLGEVPADAALIEKAARRLIG